ncbi:MAG TPA: CRTAC1 family protein, partial [Candidatus Nitrosotalea sp.]|nr:CRTAC1 family protein [Candidatus Nitrosotalea sp.]
QVNPELVARFTALEARENRVNETDWAKEILAEDCSRVFENLWDRINSATNKLDVLASAVSAEITLPRYGPVHFVPPGIQLREPEAGGVICDALKWRQFLAETESSGWQLVQIEFRHVQFDPDAKGNPMESRFQFSAHVANAGLAERAVIEGPLIVTWAPERDADGLPAIRRIDASHLSLKSRKGEPPFRRVFEQTVAPPTGSFFIDPLILYDLDGDGLSEIILASKNLVYHRRPDDRFDAAPLCRNDPGLILTALIADFDCDGAPDFLCARFDGLYLFKGTPQGTFDEPGRLVWKADPHLKYAQVMTCGDVDGDGDLDVWLGQYKVPYTRGQMPTPFYDANDGYPAYLLLNDGHGNFSDATESSGLARKRWRRTYSASLVDLDHDGDLDLMVVSDFCGTDLYENDGHGHFTDVTTRWLDEPHAAGMAHAVADFNRDGLEDLLVVGMNSPTADRLAHLGLVRNGFPDYTALRTQLMHGNRLYLGQSGGGFRQTSLSESIARSGWSWGGSAFDFDNDGYPDVYIANGHETKATVRDYESEVWLHDIYVGSSKEDVISTAYFSGKMERTRGHGYSFGGYEKNRLFLNQQGASFLEAGFLMGVALEQDCRDVVTDDLDGDGRPDLLVTTFEAWPERKQSLLIFKNDLQETNNWIGFRFREQGNGVSPVGAEVTLHFSGNRAVRQIVTGDSYRSQHANTVHFGLGKAERVDRVEIHWVNGRSLAIDQPAINRYHFISAPGPKDAPR